MSNYSNCIVIDIMKFEHNTCKGEKSRSEVIFPKDVM